MQAGLFSGVVAGFTLESYSWLQQDNSDISVQLLAQISSQLGSFSVSDGFVNSTIVPAPFASFDSPFQPLEVDVRVNVLWFLSLAISLTTSLSAIMVQQWLQAYRLPTHVSTRERVRLRQYRYDALFKWNLHYIISLLPLCLQVALILFLVGLCYLLATVDKTVAKAFISFVGLALSAHFSFTVLPIAFKSCPYRNPVAHAALVIFNVLAACVLLGAAILGLLLAYLLSYPLHLLSAGEHAKDVVALSMRMARALTAMLQYAMTFIAAHTELRGHDFWAGRDLDNLPTAKHLDRNALMAAPSVLPATDHARLNHCLRDLSYSDRNSCACVWASQELNVTTAAFTNENFGGRIAFTTATLAKIDTTFSNRFRHILLASLPDIMVCSEEEDRCHECSVLLVLRSVARTRPADPEWTNEYARRVLSTRDAQAPMDPSELADPAPWLRLVQACIFELASIVSYDFSAEGACYVQLLRGLS